MRSGLNRVEPVRIDAAVAERGIEEWSDGVGDEDEVVVEERLQPQADIDLHPVRIEIGADLAVRGIRGGDRLDLAQDAVAVIGERAREQLALGLERDVVGALRGPEHRDHDADDRDRDDDADRHHDARDARGSSLPAAVLRR